MATRPLTNVEVPALEPISLEAEPLALRRLRAAGSWARGALALDAAMLLAAVLAAELGAPDAGIVEIAPVWLVAYAALVLLLLQVRGLYSWHVRLQALDDVRAVVTASGLAAMGILTLRLFVPGDVDDLAAQSIRLAAFSAVYLSAGRIAFDWAQVKARRQGDTAKPTLIVGAGRIGRLTARRLLEHPEFGLQPVGFLDKEPLEEPGLPVPVLGASWDLERIVEQHGIEHVVVTFSRAPSEVLLREVKHCEELGIGVSLVPRLFESVTERLSVEHIGGLPLLSTRRPDPKGWHFALKYSVDRVVAMLILLAAAPLLLLLALGTRISVGRPIFFRQPRVGLDGRRFEMLKFRSMRAADEPVVLPDLPADTAPGGVEGDDRRTGFGTFLRRTSLDELPQLLNVLKGDMSLIGPRPERPDFVELFERNVHRYGDRHRVKSGITGWAQVNGLRGKTSLSDRVEWDNYYIENWSLWLDFKILLMTIWAVRRYFALAE
ncbi:MAG: exopolysaccharide biosynthesis polyprenyl glycosylphosphotransferase [Actinobacteria bacterium]|nr:MAG: exopolysaccharide biosynthesis polyprenyl glycosylphosphotransferase [Actinomycetota bacterium]